MSDWSGQIAWITGASSGIGEALALEFADAGGKVILSGRNLAELERVAGICGEANCLILPFEATDTDRLPELCKQATEWQGRVNVLVNNAGISQRSLAVETSLDVYRQIIDIDLFAPIALTQALLPTLLAQGSGHIVMISSVAGKVGAPLRTAYSAAKHGLIGYADSLRTETAGQGIKTLVVTPGSVKTNVSRNSLTAEGKRRGKSDDAIENGIAPRHAAQQIWNAVGAGTRELLVAEGLEASLVEMRGREPEKLFDLLESLVAKGYAQKMES